MNKQIWTDVLINQFRTGEEASFLKKIPSYDKFVSKSHTGVAETINMTEVGAAPEVLVNNTTYPIPAVKRNDTNVAITLDKYDTKNTIITDDEVKHIAYDKVRSVTESHVQEVDKTKYAKAVHALTPQQDREATPAIPTSGDDDGTGRKKMTKKDILALKRRMDNNKIPINGRILVLCGDHYNDMLEEDESFSRQLMNPRTGELLPYMGFEIHMYPEAPLFNANTGVKKAFGQSADANSVEASTAFYAPDHFRATGSSKAYASASKDDPTMRQSLFGIRHYFICLPRRQRAIGAIFSKKI